MIKILFICHGNICRSPMAEFIMKDLVRRHGLENQVYVASAATSREEEGSGIYGPARRMLEAHHIPWTHRRARRITRQDVKEFDRIYYMDRRNAQYLRQLFPGESKFQPLLNRDVADPWYTGDFEATWADLLEGCEIILKELEQ